ncbi:MAG: phosphoglycerate kinase [Waddliaceae bacterium]|nr:phosphoglycerate kinase [Waddliaceae bacterium]
MKKNHSLQDLIGELSGKKVLIRVDFNVPLDDDGVIVDDTRIVAALPTIRAVLDNGGAAIIMSPLGRPKGVRDEAFSLKPCVDSLSTLLGIPVLFASDCIGEDVSAMKKSLKPGEVLVLENLRFHAAETKPEEDSSFSESLADGADIYVNDAFGTAHRKHSSTFYIAKHFPGNAVSGFLMDKEIAFLGDALADPKRPFYAVIGGAKVSSKLGVLRSLIENVDGIIIGGGMSYTFLKAQGIAIGDSICEEDLLQEALDIIASCREKGVKLILPDDIVVADSFDENAMTQIIATKDGIPDGYQGMDIGPKTIETFSEMLSSAKTILWNGPLGVYEMKPFAKGTEAIAYTLAESEATTIVGGGDCVAAVKTAGVAEKISHISTGGGAALEYIEKRTLPCVEALVNP